MRIFRPGNNVAIRLAGLGLFFLLVSLGYAGARDIRHVEFVRYGQNNPDSPTKSILKTAEWIAPLLRPNFFELDRNSDVSFITRTTLYLDRETLDILAPNRSGDFATLISQDMAQVGDHPGLFGAPLLVCFYGPRSRNWGRPSSVPSDIPLETVLAHAGGVKVNLYWNIIDHPPYQAIPNHPLRRIGAFRAICPGEAHAPFVRQFERLVRGTAEWVVKWGFQLHAPVRNLDRPPLSVRLAIGLEYRVAVMKRRPQTQRNGWPLSDPPPVLLRYNVTSVAYDTLGPNGLAEMDFVPIQFLLTERYSGLPRGMTAQVTPGQVAAARMKNKQQSYHICRYRQGHAAYWVWSDAFPLRYQGHEIRSSKGAPDRPVFSCPLDPGALWR
ncbi:hypothetical protein [Rhodovulum sulfidophilum]|uniref:DUF3142 domain-containing protein n=1 Tax=Rhodovulum sulfidophilum TaxID=35806 RepID=A0ABS1RZQ2_RHOSU|nr:hypothetical protein [Rhodovulum sulfidophilum]MBL3611183.1 hypothetical protein [Rhodovulum sulfidophilum]MCE8455726.1 hypothetical protein [Rhodovulum sulfidophilum]